MMKPDVAYKLPKKMKKRRQLDALVTTGKLPRNRKNSNNSAQELLDFHSDSSDVEEYAANSMGRGSKKCCVCHSFLPRLGLFLASVACLTTCFGLVWVQWHLRHELDTLRDELESVQNKDNQAAMLQFHKQLAGVNSSINNLRTDSITNISNDIGLMKIELNKLKNTFKELSETITMTDRKEILSLPTSLKSLADTVASATNDLNEVKHRVDDLMASKSTLPPITTAEPDISTAKLSQDIMKLNASLDVRLANQTQKLLEYIDKMPALKNAKNMSVLDGNNIELVKDIVFEMLANHTMDISGNESVGISSRQLNALKLRVKKIESFKEEFYLGEFSVFKDDTLKEFEVINSTLLTFNQDLTLINDRMSLQAQGLTNISSLLAKGALSLGDTNSTQSSSMEEASSSAESTLLEKSNSTVMSTSSSGSDEMTALGPPSGTTLVGVEEVENKTTVNPFEDTEENHTEGENG